MRDETVRGRAPREAARLIEESGRDEDAGTRGLIDALVAAGRSFHAIGVRRTLEAAATALGTDHAIQAVAVPALREIGDQWKSGVCGVADEHFLTQEVRTWFVRLAVLAPDPYRTGRIVLACGPDETHSIALDAFAAVLARRGWPCINLGARTPVRAVVDAASAPHVCGLVVTSQRRVTKRSAVEALRAVAKVKGVSAFYAGATFGPRTARAGVPGTYLGDNLVAAAEIIADTVAGAASRPSVAEGR